MSAPDLAGGSTMTCGYIGLGIMGRAMVRNLLSAGHEVVVHNRSPAAVEQLAAEGAIPGGGYAQVAQRADVTFCCLVDSAVVEEVVLGEGGVLEGAASGSVLVDFSTVSPDTARLLARRCAERGVAALDAPVSGGEQGAVEGTLAIMAGGDAEAFAKVRPLLEAVGTTVVHVGPPGSGQTVKVANQLLVGGIIGLVSEALLLLETGGVELEPALEVLAGGLAGNRVLERKGRDMLARSFQPGARADLHRKDLTIALQVARDAAVPVPITAVVAQLYEALHATGRGDLDHGAVLALLTELAGRDVAKDRR